MDLVPVPEVNVAKGTKGDTAAREIVGWAELGVVVLLGGVVIGGLALTGYIVDKIIGEVEDLRHGKDDSTDKGGLPWWGFVGAPFLAVASIGDSHWWSGVGDVDTAEEMGWYLLFGGKEYNPRAGELGWIRPANRHLVENARSLAKTYGSIAQYLAKASDAERKIMTYETTDSKGQKVRAPDAFNVRQNFPTLGFSAAMFDQDGHRDMYKFKTYIQTVWDTVPALAAKKDFNAIRGLVADDNKKLASELDDGNAGIIEVLRNRIWAMQQYLKQEPAEIRQLMPWETYLQSQIADRTTQERDAYLELWKSNLVRYRAQDYNNIVDPPASSAEKDRLAASTSGMGYSEKMDYLVAYQGKRHADYIQALRGASSAL